MWFANLLIRSFRQYLEETLSQEAAEKAAAGGIGQGEKISRSSLEEEARESSLKGHGTPEERYVQYFILFIINTICKPGFANVCMK